MSDTLAETEAEPRRRFLALGAAMLLAESALAQTPKPPAPNTAAVVGS